MGDITLRRALEEYVSIFMASRNFSPKTRVEYLNDIEDLIAFLEELGLREVRNLSLQHLQRYLAELDRRGNKGSTRKRKVVSIRSFLWYLYQDQYTRINLANKIIPPFSEARSIRYLSKSEYERLLKVASISISIRDRTIVQLLLYTGIKLSELTRLTINDVQLVPGISAEASEKGHLNVVSSGTRKGRVIDLNSKASLCLRIYLKFRGTEIQGEALFTNRFGTPVSPRGVEKIVRKYILLAGVSKASAQSLRHTFAVEYVSSGASLRNIQDTMGITHSRTALEYFSLARREGSSV